MKTKILLGLSIVYLLASVGCKKDSAKPGSPPPGKQTQTLTFEYIDGNGDVFTELFTSMSQGDQSVAKLIGFAPGAAISATSSDDNKATVAIDSLGAITVNAVDTSNPDDAEVVLTFTSPDHGNSVGASISRTLIILGKPTPPPGPQGTDSVFDVKYSGNTIPLLTMTSANVTANTDKVIVVVYEIKKRWWSALRSKSTSNEVKFWGTIDGNSFKQNIQLSDKDYIKNNTTKSPKGLSKSTTYSIAIFSVDNPTASKVNSKDTARDLVEKPNNFTGIKSTQNLIYQHQ